VKNDNKMNFKHDNSESIRSLRFSVVEVSSEDLDYPADVLTEQNYPPRGWQTQRSAFFPQYIVFRFHGPCLVHQFKLLSHQAKIASKVDVYISKPEEGCFTPNFQKLGYFPLSNNEGSAFQAREIKIVQIGLPITFIKLVLHQPHPNSLNFFNQAGIVAVSFVGYHLLEKETVTLSIQDYTIVNIKNVVPSEVQGQIQHLEALKAQAVVDEDFLLAKQLKEEIQKMKAKFTELLNLEQEKRKAIEREDYDTAIQIKAKIEQSKANLNIPLESKSINRHSTARNPSPNSRNEHMPNSSIVSGYSYNQEYSNAPLIYQTYRSANPKDINQPSKPVLQPRPDSRSRIADGLSSNSPKLRMNLEEKVKTNRSLEIEQRPYSQRFQKRSPEPKRAIEINTDHYNIKPPLFVGNPSPRSETEKRQLPTLIHKAETSCEHTVEEKPEDVGDGGQWPRILEKNLNKIDQLSRVFTRTFLAQAFSMQIVDRIKTIEKLIESLHITSGSEDLHFAAEIFIGRDLPENLIGSFKLTLSFYEERSPQLVNFSLQIFDFIIAYVHEHNLQGRFRASAESELLITEFMVATYEKISDYRNVALISAISKVLSLICRSQLESLDGVISQLILSKSPKTKVENFKNRIGQLKIVKNLFDEFHQTDSKLGKNAFAFAAQMLENANKDVRSQARDLIVKIAESTGEDQVIKQLEQLQVRKNNLDEVKRQISKQKKIINLKTLTDDKQTKTIPAKDLEQSLLEISSTTVVADFGEQQVLNEQEISQKTCHFCKRSDLIFNDMDRFDYHLWKECRMLTSCRECLQIIEVADYNAHLLSECKNAELHCACPRCRQIVNVDQLDDHVASLECAPLDLTLPIVRCPLCHFDLKVKNGDFEEAWRQHLIIQSCPNNLRS